MDYKNITNKIAARLNGGQGSGNYGHAGRPGEIGGSAKTRSPIGDPWFDVVALSNCDSGMKTPSSASLGKEKRFITRLRLF